MQAKNYYQILGVSPQAGVAEIKTAYRKLAMQVHPDKNDDEDLSERAFMEINEAYTVLSDKTKRAAYDSEHFKELKEIEQLHVTPEYILRELQNLRKKTEFEDPYRMDRTAFITKLEQIFSAYHLSVLHKENNLRINNSVVDETLSVLRLLPVEEQRKVTELFNSFSHNRKEKSETFLRRQKNISFWEKYKFMVVLLITIIVCAIIYQIIK